MAKTANPVDAFRDALNKETGGGRDMDKAREISDRFIADNPELFRKLIGLDSIQIAKAVDVARESGLDDEVTLLEIWVRSRFEPQKIGGEATATVRLVPGLDS